MQVRKKDTGRIYALKTIRKAHIVSRSEVTHTLAERTVLAQITNPFIVPLKFCFQNPDKLYLVLSLVHFSPARLLYCESLIGPTSFVASLMVESYSIICSVKVASVRNGRDSIQPSFFRLSSAYTQWTLSIGKHSILHACGPSPLL